MKKHIFLSILCLGLFTMGSVTCFAADVGKDKVPKTELVKDQTSFDLNVVIFDQVSFEVAKNNGFVSVGETAVKITKAEKSFDYTGLVSCEPRSCKNDAVLYIKHQTPYNLSTLPGYRNSPFYWKNYLKQCICSSNSDMV